MVIFKNISGLNINSSKTEGMWIGSFRGKMEEPFSIKWPKTPIKALGVYFKYDTKLLKEKNFIERLDSIKKLINIWSSRGLSLYGKVTIIKSFLISKFVYVFSVLLTPKEVASESNRMPSQFLWNGVDKVTRVSAINDYERGGLKMIDVDCMIRSLRLGWLQRVFIDSSATWKRYFLYLLEHVGGIFFLSCNFDVKDFNLPSPFYYELLQWWPEFRATAFAEEKHYKNIWNNKEIKIDNKPVYFKNYREAGITYTQDLLFDRDIKVAFTHLSKKINKTNFLQWAGQSAKTADWLEHSDVNWLVLHNCACA